MLSLHFLTIFSETLSENVCLIHTKSFRRLQEASRLKNVYSIYLETVFTVASKFFTNDYNEMASNTLN